MGDNVAGDALMNQPVAHGLALSTWQAARVAISRRRWQNCSPCVVFHLHQYRP